MLLHAHVVQHRHHLPPQRLSVAHVLQAYRSILREYKSDPDPGESLTEPVIAAVTDDSTRTNKRGRNHPRKKAHEPTPKPVVVKATKSQVLKAQQLHAA